MPHPCVAALFIPAPLCLPGSWVLPALVRPALCLCAAPSLCAPAALPVLPGHAGCSSCLGLGCIAQLVRCLCLCCSHCLRQLCLSHCNGSLH